LSLLQGCRWVSSIGKRDPDFGILFDIDGVIVRGKRVLPSSPEAFKLLVDEKVKAIVCFL